LQTREINVEGKATVWTDKGDLLVIKIPRVALGDAPEDGKDETEARRRHEHTWEPRDNFAEKVAKQAAATTGDACGTSRKGNITLSVRSLMSHKPSDSDRDESECDIRLQNVSIHRLSVCYESPV
jgi:hypothetical protein